MMPKSRRSDRLVGPAPLAQLDVDQRALKRALEVHVVAVSHAQWPGNAAIRANTPPPAEVGIRSIQYLAAPGQRTMIQIAGSRYGCHTCLTDVSTDGQQPWTGDHIPPTNLRDSVARAIMPQGWDGRRKLLAQCDVCASQQADVVRRLNQAANGAAAVYAALSAHEKQLITGGRAGTIVSHGPRVSPGEGQQVQAEGVQSGCHSCNRTVASGLYHADHLPPAEFLTAYMREVCRVLGIDTTLIESPVLRPQCKRCSNAQGGNLAAITARALRFANRVGIQSVKAAARGAPY